MLACEGVIVGAFKLETSDKAGKEEAVVVYGEEGERAAQLGRALLPWTVMAPAATLRRLLLDASLHRSQACPGCCLPSAFCRTSAGLPC